MREKEIEHNAIVSSIEKGVVFVTVESTSACAGCHAKGSCTMSETSEKIIQVRVSDNPNLKIGSSVTVAISKKAGIIAIIMAYIIPVFLIVASLFLFNELKVSELLSFTWMILIIICYYIILYITRDKILNKINIKIKI